MTDRLVEHAQRRLIAEADPDRATAMAAYMKTDMAFYGVQAPARRKIVVELRRMFPPADQIAYRTQVDALWSLDHREEKYLAVALARQDVFVTSRNLDLYERMIREGAWWDFVDEIAAHLVGGVLRDERAGTTRVLDCWVDDEDLWIRRSAILAQLRHGSETDEAMLFDYCLRRAHEDEFFIRKAIGWALRAYAKSAPAAVSDFVDANVKTLSPLSVREATKHLA